MKTNSASKSNEIPGWWLSSRACALLLTAGGGTFTFPAAALAQFPASPSTPEVGESDVAATDLNKAATGFDRTLVVGFAIPETERSQFRAVPDFLADATQAPPEGQAVYLYKTNLYYVESETFEILSIVDISDLLKAEPALVEQMVVGYEVPVDDRVYLIERKLPSNLLVGKPKQGDIVRVLNGEYVLWLDEQTYKINRIEKMNATKEAHTRTPSKVRDSAQAEEADEAAPKVADPKEARPKEANPKDANPPKANPKEATSPR